MMTLNWYGTGVLAVYSAHVSRSRACGVAWAKASIRTKRKKKKQHLSGRAVPSDGQSYSRSVIYAHETKGNRTNERINDVLPPAKGCSHFALFSPCRRVGYFVQYR